MHVGDEDLGQALGRLGGESEVAPSPVIGYRNGLTARSDADLAPVGGPWQDLHLDGKPDHPASATQCGGCSRQAGPPSAGEVKLGHGGPDHPCRFTVSGQSCLAVSGGKSREWVT